MSSLLSRRESDNAAAVIEARLEIEKIKTELETLINSNIKTQSHYTASMSLIPQDVETILNTNQDTNKAKPVFLNSPKPLIKTSSIRPATSPNMKKIVPPFSEDTLIESSRPRSRPYDPEKTREFIKKQKQRRKEKLLEEEQKKQEKECTRKQKLEELKKKTLQLVAKNLKKSTNKSAKTTSDVNSHNMSKSNAQAQLDNNKSMNKFALQSRRCRARSFDHGNRDKDSDSNYRSRSISREITKATSIHSEKQKNLPVENQPLIDTKSQVTLQSSLQKSLTPTPKTNIATKKSSPKPNETSTHNSSKENVKLELAEPEVTNLNLETQNQQKQLEHNCEKSDAAKELSEIKQKLETSITQIKDKNELELWLQPPSSVPYPYNFISAVRKKLEYVTRKQPSSPADKNDENNKLNASIQCTIDKKILDVNSVNIPRLESPKHNNRTYESHKCRRQLYVPDKIRSSEIEININKSESDSDTTKNIPEIPHEETAQPPHKNSFKIAEDKKDVTFDKSVKSTSSISKNITFERSIPAILNIGDIKLPEPEEYAGLIPPDDKIEIPNNSRKNRSKYPDDIDSILSHYSKIKSEQNSYSDDFNSASSKPESHMEYKQIPSVSKTGSISISEYLPQNYSNSSSKENIFESHEKSNKSQNRKANSSILSENRTVSTETNVTMKGVPSLSSKQSDVVSDSIQTVSNLNESEAAKKLTKPEFFLKRRPEENENNRNHIHLKLQAEVHLLNSFNNSLKQVVAVEKSVFDVPSTSTKHFNPINCKRGCDFPEVKASTENIAITNGGQHNLTSMRNISDIDYDSICSQDFRISNVERSSLSTTIASKTTTIASNSIISRRDDVDLKSHPYVAISLDMVDQMIKDEDIRLEHLKAVLKLRDQALFDRIKGELALLEIRKRELREHGLTNDITAIKKKQRGLIIKLQQERHEMHRLKTAHKQAAKARKTALHEQKSIIKTQLSSTDQIPKKLRRLSQLERPSLGPIKVYRVDSSKTEVSETTLSRKGSDDSVTNSSVLTQISEKISVEKSEIYYSDSLAVEPIKPPNLQSEKLKRSLLMKEAEIDKRRKEIEELIKWQKRLKQKEAEVVELERKAVKSLQSDDQQKVRVFSGAHLNKVWKGIALPDKNFDEEKKYQMSKRSLDKFYQNARKMFKEVSEEEKQLKTESYSSEFEQTNSTSRLDASLNEVEVAAANRLLHISDIISIPETESSIKEHASSSEDVSSIQEDNKSVSLSESPSVKTEVNTLMKSDSKIDSIQSEFLDSLQIKLATKTKSLELIIASEYSSQKPDESVVAESLKTDSLETSLGPHIESENSLSLQEAAREDTSIASEISSANRVTSDKSQSEIVVENIKDSLDSSIKSVSDTSVKFVPEILETIISEESEAQVLETEKSSPKQTAKSDTDILDSIASEISSLKTSEPQIIDEIVSEKSVIEVTEKSTSQELDNVSPEISSAKIISEASEPQLLEENTSVEATERSTASILDNVVASNVSSAKTDSEISQLHVLEEIISVEATEKTSSHISDNVVASEESSVKTVSEVSQPQILDNITPVEITDKTGSQILENVISETNEKVDLEILENISSDTPSIPKSAVSTISEAPEKSVLDIPEYTESLNSIIKSEVSASITEVENVDSHHSSAKPISATSEDSEPLVLEEASSILEVEESLGTPAIQAQEDLINSDGSNKAESWEPQILSEVKSNLSEKQINSETEVNEHETKSKTNSETYISEQNLQTDATSPRSEFQYETDFDKFSESDQSKIETESNVSLKETNVDSSINEDESNSENIKSKDEEEETSEAHSNTIKVSPKDPEKSDSESHEDEDTDSKKGVSHIDVRKRVSEILADANANGPRGDKSPRVQDLYTTTYDIAGSSEGTPESGSPTNEFSKQEKASFSPETPYINEAEELLRKQLEIEQEIKRLERQQQNIPYLFMREIPNKPPPPYKPPDFPLTPVIASIIPSKPEQTKKIINDAAAALYSAYTTGDLTNTTSKTKDDQQRFMFDLCKEIALEACKPTIEAKIPCWKTQKNKFHNLFAKRPITKDTLNSVLSKKVLQLLNFEPVTRNDSLIIRWSRKKRDHVDEILVSETQAEEAEWTNFDSDEEIIKENLTQTILQMLIVDASKDVNDVLKKKKCFRWLDC